MNINLCPHNNNGFFEGPLILEPNIYSDNRGTFYESWNMKDFNKFVNEEIKFVQDNQSISHKGVLRGLHYQKNPMEQGKLVNCTYGSVYDVIVDLREESNTFTFWAGIELNDINKKQLWIPPGFAHGFISLEDNSIFAYKVTNYWSKKDERSLLWNDPKIKIKWPNLIDKIISKKDLGGFSLDDLELNDDLFQ